MSHPLWYINHMMNMTKEKLNEAWNKHQVHFELADDVVAISEASVLLPIQTAYYGQATWYKLNDEELDYINDEFYSEIEDAWHEHWEEKCR